MLNCVSSMLVCWPPCDLACIVTCGCASSVRTMTRMCRWLYAMPFVYLCYITSRLAGHSEAERFRSQECRALLTCPALSLQAISLLTWVAL